MTKTTARKGVRLTKRQAEVYDVFTAFGVALPDHALVPLAQHACSIHQSSSGIRTRRAELARKGLLRQSATTRTGSGRRAAVYKVV